MDILELIRLLRAGEGDRAIAGLLARNRRTIAKYRRWADQQGLLHGPLPTGGELHHRLTQTLPDRLPPQQTSSVAAYREEIAAYRARGMEVAAIRTRLEELHCQPISYSAVWRLVQHLEPLTADAFVRVEVPPGSEAQVDFGYAGRMLDPATDRPRKSWVFVMILSWSRHLYAELVFDQRVETWLLCHRHAFERLGGVPARIVLDNLKAGIVHACVHEPTAQRAYRECAQHYGFLIDPNPPRSPHLKGKVEQGGVHYVTRNFLAGRDPEPLPQLNAKLWRWIDAVAGVRVHGTTKQLPLTRFRQVEQATLLPLPAVPYDPAGWKQVRLHRDCHLTFDGSFYSAPFRLVGQALWVRGGARTIEIFTTAHELVATHTRAAAPGERHTQLDHLPPEKVPGLTLTREDCRLRAEGIGVATAALVQELLDHRPEDRLRPAGRVVRLATRYGTDRVERACARALHFGDPTYPTVKRILQQGLEAEPLPTAAAGPPPTIATWQALPSLTPRRYTFVRTASEFVAGLLGGVR